MSKPSITDYQGAERGRTEALPIRPTRLYARVFRQISFMGALLQHPNDISGRWSDRLERDIADRLLVTDQDWSDPLE